MSEQDSPYAGVPGFRGPDVSWASGIALVADQERLAKKHSTVTLVNTSEQTKHVIVDRHLQPITLQPGQRKEGVEMVNDELEQLMRYRTPGRFYPDQGDKRGQPKPDHPVLVEDIAPREMPPAQRAENEKRADAARRQ